MPFKMVYISPRSFLGVAWLTLPILVRALEPFDASPSPAADTELICPSDNALECYPRIFQPTENFQDIKEGQDLPPGLHIRMDINTGQKEARLNIPMEGEESTAELEGIPIEQAMVVVEQPEEEAAPEEPVLRDQAPQEPPAFEAAGKIPPPPPSEGGDIGSFHKAMMSIRVEARAFDTALDELSELSHDIYYGVEIAKDGPVLEKLICLTLGSGSDKFPATENKRDHKAATILASSIQNNPTALKEVASMGKLVMYPTCGTNPMNPGKKGGNFVSILRGRLGREKDPSTLKSKVNAISGLLRDPKIRKEYITTGGMEMLLAIWLKKGEQFDTVRVKVAQLVSDNFLDESMGAALGIWPKKPQAADEACGKKGKNMLQEGCWEYHVGAFSQANPDSTWAADFLRLLKEQRAVKRGSVTKDREL